MAGRSSVSSASIASSPALIPLGHHSGKSPIPLLRPVTVIGSRSNARIHLTSSTVSKAHALVVRDGPVTYIRDLASRNKVYVNGQDSREHDLQNDDLIKIGSFTFKFQDAAHPTDATAAEGLPPGQLQVAGADYPVPIDQRVLLIGRRRVCDVHLLEESVSTAHAVIFEMNGQRFVRDLGSRTGTFVNGVQVHQHQLNAGDSIHIGDTTLTYVPIAAFETAEAAPGMESSASGLDIVDDSMVPVTTGDSQHGQQAAPEFDEIDFSHAGPSVQAESEAAALDALGLAAEPSAVVEKTPPQTGARSARSTVRPSADKAVEPPPLSEASESLSTSEEPSESETRFEAAADEVAEPDVAEAPLEENLSPRRGWRTAHQEPPASQETSQEQDESVLRISPEPQDESYESGGADESSTAVAEPSFTAGSFVDDGRRDTLDSLEVGEAEEHASPEEADRPVEIDLSALAERSTSDESLDFSEESDASTTVETPTPQRSVPNLRFDQEEAARESRPPVEPVEEAPAKRTRKSRKVKPSKEEPGADEVLERTEPTPESALPESTLDAAIDEAGVEAVLPPPVEPEALTDTGLSRAIEEFAGDAGNIVESPTDEATSAETPVEPQPVESQLVEPPAADAPAQPGYEWGANQENFLGGRPVKLVEEQTAKTEETAPARDTNFEDVNALIDEILAPNAQQPQAEAAPTADDLLAGSETGEVVEELDELSLEDDGKDLLETTTPTPGDETPGDEKLDFAPDRAEHVGPGATIPLPPPMPLPPPAFAPSQSRPVVPIPPPPARGGRRERRRRGAETLEPVGATGTRGLREDERIPPYAGGALPATVGRVTTGFDGLAMPPVRETDVFFQMSPPAPGTETAEDPFAGQTASAMTPMDLVQPEEPPARQRRAPATGRAHVPRDLFFGSTAPAPGNGGTISSLSMPEAPAAETPEQPSRRRESKRPTIPTTSPVPQVPHALSDEEAANRWPAVVLGEEDVDAVAAARRRRSRLVTLVLVACIVFWGAATAAIVYLMPPTSVTEVPIRFENFDQLNTAERKQLRDEQQALIGTEMTRNNARRLLSQHDAEISPGFLDDTERYLATVTLASWPESRKGTYVLRYKGKADQADKSRMYALAQAVIQANESRVKDAKRAKQQYEDLLSSISRNEQEQKQLGDEIEKLRTAGDSALDQREINKLKEDVQRLDKAWGEAISAVKACEAELTQLKSANNANANPQTPDATEAAPGATDDQITQMEAKLKDLTGKVTAAQSAKAQQAEAAKKQLDSSLADFENQVAAARELSKDSPELASYVAAAQRLQETTRSLIDDLIRRQEHQYTRLNDLKSQLVDKMEQRRLEQFNGDPQLRDLNERLETEKRMLNAAKASGHKKDAEERQAAIDLLNSMIKSRQELVPKDALKDYADTIAQLQQIIDVTQKNVEEDRKRTETLLADLQKEFTNTQTVAKLPEAQKSTAAELEKKIADINAARQQYNQAISATATDDDDTTKETRTQIAALQSGIEARRKELTDARERNRSQEQEKSRQELITQKEAELTELKQTETNARLARMNREKDFHDATTAARDARESLDRLQSLQQRKDMIDNQVAQARRDESRLKEAAERAVQPLQVSEDEVKITEDPDKRPIWWGASTGIIFLVFAGLLLFTLHQSSPEMAVRSMAQRNRANHAPEPQPSAAPSTNGNGTAPAPTNGDGHQDDDQQPAVV